MTNPVSATRSNSYVLNIVLTIVRLLTSYIKYFFLTGVVLLTVFFLIFTIINFDLDSSFSYLRYLSFLDPKYGEGSFSMVTQDFLEIYFVVSFLFWAIASSIKLVLKMIFKIKTSLPLKSRGLLLFGGISLTFVIAMISALIADNVEDSIYVILAVFYVLNIFSLAGYIVLDVLLDKISKFIKKSFAVGDSETITN